jgi:hypothetical protein
LRPDASAPARSARRGTVAPTPRSHADSSPTPLTDELLPESLLTHRLREQLAPRGAGLGPVAFQPLLFGTELVSIDIAVLDDQASHSLGRMYREPEADLRSRRSRSSGVGCSQRLARELASRSRARSWYSPGLAMPAAPALRKNPIFTVVGSTGKPGAPERVRLRQDVSVCGSRAHRHLEAARMKKPCASCNAGASPASA